MAVKTHCSGAWEEPKPTNTRTSIFRAAELWVQLPNLEYLVQDPLPLLNSSHSTFFFWLRWRNCAKDPMHSPVELPLNSQSNLELFQNPVLDTARNTILSGFRHMEKYLKPFFILILIQSKFSSHISLTVGTDSFFFFFRNKDFG